MFRKNTREIEDQNLVLQFREIEQTKILWDICDAYKIGTGTTTWPAASRKTRAPAWYSYQHQGEHIAQGIKYVCVCVTPMVV